MALGTSDRAGYPVESGAVGGALSGVTWDHPQKSGLDPLTLQFSNLLVPTSITLTCLISHSVLLSDRKESFS